MQWFCDLGIIGLFGAFGQRRARERIGAKPRVSGAVLGASELCFSTSCVSKDNAVVQSVSRSVLQQWSDPWSDHRIRKRSIVSLDILITMTLCKLARLLSGTEFCSHERIHFQTQPRYMVCKYSLFGRTFEQKNWKCAWNRVSGAKTPARECT